ALGFVVAEWAPTVAVQNQAGRFFSRDIVGDAYNEIEFNFPIEQYGLYGLQDYSVALESRGLPDDTFRDNFFAGFDIDFVCMDQQMGFGISFSLTLFGEIVEYVVPGIA